MKKALSIILVFLMLLTALPFAASAEGEIHDGIWTYYVNDYDKNAWIVDCDSNVSGEVTIPAELNGYQVNLYSEVFFECPNIKSFKVENGQKNLASIDGVLYRINTDENYETGEKVTYLSLLAYPQAKTDKNYDVPTGVAYVDFYTPNQYIETITLSDTVENFSEYYYYYEDEIDSPKLPSLKSISVNSGNEYLYSIDGVLFDKEIYTDDNGDETVVNILEKYPCQKSNSSYTVPDGVGIIGSRAFSFCSNLTEITIPDSVNEINYGAFCGCLNLSKLSFPYGFTSITASMIQDTALYNDPKNWEDGMLYINNCLVGVDFDKIGENVTVKDGTISVSSSAFYGCSEVKKVVLPDSVETIGDNAFSWCDNLSDIYLGTRVKQIKSDAFYGCASLKSITIPDSTVYIGDYAFSDCILLSSVKMGVNVETIGHSAFSYCASLQSISLPSSLKEIGSNLFYECTMLENIFIPSGLDNITSNTFYGTAAYDNGLEDGIVYISGYLVMANREKVSGDIVIKNGTTDICSYAFNYCDSVESVTIPDSVINIDDGAFHQCYSLSNVKMSSNIKKIGNHAFSWTDVNSIDFGKKLEYIGDSAFEYSDLNSVSIPASVNIIGEDAFWNCDYLSSISVDSSNKYYSSQNGVLYNKAKTELIKYPDYKKDVSFNIPSTVTVIDNNAFYSADFEEINIPSSVKEYIGMAFEECYSLKKISVDSANSSFSSDGGVMYNKNETELIKIPQNMESETYTILPTVKLIRDYAGYDCDNINALFVPKSVESIGHHAFEYCNGIETVDLSNVVTIGDYAFLGCNNLKSCTFGTKTENIGDNAFSYTALTEVNIPSSVKDIYYSFVYCQKLEKITVDPLNENYSSKDGILYNKDKTTLEQYPAAKASTSFTLPSSVEQIGSYAFYYAENLSTINLNEGLKYISSESFYCCSALTQIIIPDTVEILSSGAFEYCSSLKEVVLGKSVREIDYCCFEGCSSLESIAIPDSVEYLGGSTFENCTSLKSVSLSNNLTSIPYDCFYGCRSLEKISIPKSVRNIGESAFYDCALTSVTISYMVEEIDDNAFGYRYNNDDWMSEKVPGFKIYCYDESAGMDYAEENGFDYEILPDDADRPPRRTISDEETGVEVKFNNEFEKGTELNVEREYDGTSFTIIGKEFGEVNSAVYDINAYKDGEKVQPNGMVTVRIPVPYEFDTSRLAVCYINAETKELTIIPAKVEDGYIVFQTDHFSYYAIVEVATGRVMGVSVSDITMNYKKSTTIMPDITADPDAEYTIEYESSNPKIATVDENGNVYAAKKGEATITCTVTDSNGNTVSDTCNVKVKYSFGQWLIKILLFGWIWY